MNIAQQFEIAFNSGGIRLATKTMDEIDTVISLGLIPKPTPQMTTKYFLTVPSFFIRFLILIYKKNNKI